MGSSGGTGWSNPGGGYTYFSLAPGTGIKGDNVTDDSAAIGAWWAKLPAGSTAFMQAATYKIAGVIPPAPGQLTVMGEGDSTVLNVTADGITALTPTVANNRSSWARFMFQLAASAPTSALVDLNGTFNHDFDRVTFIGQKTSQAATFDGQVGVLSQNNAGDSRFRACTFIQLGIGAAQDCEETTYEGCHFSGNKVDLLTFGPGAGANVIGGIMKGSSNTAGQSTSDYGFLFLGQGHHQVSNGWSEAVNTACMQVGQNVTANTTVGAASNGVTLPTRTITANTAGFPSAGTATIVTTAGTVTFAYTAIDAGHFLNCVGGSGTMATGAAIATAPVGPVMCSVPSLFVNGGALHGLDVQKGRFVGGNIVIGSPSTFATPLRLDGVNSSGVIDALDIPSITSQSALKALIPSSYRATFHYGGSPGAWASSTDPLPVLAFVNETSFTEAATAVTGTVTPGNAGGNLLVLYIAYRTTALNVVSVTDTEGNVWTAGATGQAGEALYYLLAPGDVGTVTVTMSGAATLAMSCVEVSGAQAVIDKNAVATAASTAITATTAATTNADDIVLAFVAQQANAPAFSAQSAGYTVLPQHVSATASPLSIQAAYQIVAATGPQTYSVTSSSAAAWFEDVVAFKGS